MSENNEEINFIEYDDPDFKDWLKPFIDFDPPEEYISWLQECANKLNVELKELKRDCCWFYAFDDNLTIDEAVNEYKKFHNLE